jgi:hypothetical protein
MSQEGCKRKNLNGFNCCDGLLFWIGLLLLALPNESKQSFSLLLQDARCRVELDDIIVARHDSTLVIDHSAVTDISGFWLVALGEMDELRIRPLEGPTDDKLVRFHVFFIPLQLV